MDLAQARVDGTRVTYGDDKGLLVEFVDDAVEQPFETEKMGRAIFKSVAFISIIFPGDKTKKTYRPATDEDKKRFAQQWAFFEKGEKAIENGTPITQWNYLSKSQALELKHMGFWTVELLANASDTQVSSFMGGMSLRKQAQAFIASSAGNSTLTSVIADNDRLKAENEVIKENMAAMKAQIDSMMNSKNVAEAPVKSTLKLKGE